MFKAIPLGVSEAAFNETLLATLSPNSLVLINYLDMHLTLLGETNVLLLAGIERKRKALIKIIARR